MDLKGLIADQMGHFTPYQITGVVLAVVLAALVSYATAIISGGPGREIARSTTVLAAIVAFAVALVRASVPLSIALVACALLVRGILAGEDRASAMLRVAAVAIGVGCGSSSGIVVLAAFVPLALLLRWSFTAR